VLFFSVSQSKLPGYVLTAVIAAGVLVARVLDLALATPGGRAHRLVIRGAWALAAVTGASAVVLALALHTPGGLPALLGVRGGELARLGPAVRPLLWLCGAVALLAAAGAARRDLRVTCAALAAPPLLLLTVAFGGMRAYADADSARDLARRMPPLGPAVRLACLECLPNGLPFYLHRTITVISRDGSETTSNYVTFWLRRTTAWPDGIVRLDALGRWLAWRSFPVFLMAGARNHARLDSLATASGATAVALADGWWGALLPAPPGAIGGR
jgi:hypothetical protein